MPSDSTGTAPDEPQGEPHLLVELRGSLYGLDGAMVREIVPIMAATRLPGAPAWVRGVSNLRGQLLTVLDIGHRLTGTPLVAPDASTVVVQSGDRALGLLVDDVHEVQPLDVVPAERETLARAHGLLSGLGRLGDEVVLVIDIPELVRQTLA